MILIDMEMPSSCDECTYCGSDYKCKNHDPKIYRKDVSKHIFTRHPECPFKKVIIDEKNSLVYQPGV